MCSLGFSFEYSATFAQSGSKHENLRQTYTKAILFDYSYRHFYGDGYGKQSQILNLQANPNAQDEFRYLVASLLSYYQQLRLFEEQKASFKPFNLEKPLWVFVSSKVTATLSSGEASDTVQVLAFIDQVLHKQEETVAAIDYLLKRGMVVKGGTDLLHGRFNYLKELGEGGDALYHDLLGRVFSSSGGRLHIENITGIPGEIALRAGTSDTPSVSSTWGMTQSWSNSVRSTTYSLRILALVKACSRASTPTVHRSTCCWARRSSLRAGAVGVFLT